MRLGGPVINVSSPEEWTAAHRKAGYRAAVWWGFIEIDDYLRAARDADLVIAEVGAWSNPLSTVAAERKAAIAYCQEQLALADRVGARCCVNIAGSRGAKWDGPCAEDLTEATFDLIVESVREILDGVNPTRTYYTLEPMPWMYPDSADSYLRLIKAIDRRGFGVHLDPVNMINCPARFFRSDLFLCDAFEKLGPYIKCCHIKDVVLRDHMTVHIDHVRPGAGSLAFDVLLREMAKLDPDTPMLLEHLEEDEYPVAANYLHEMAVQMGVTI